MALGALFALGLGIRLYDLTDPPVDFHPTRQLRSALIARGRYYQNLPAAPAEKRAAAVSQWRLQGTIEPEIIESLTAATYRLAGGEYVWIARIYSSLFWILSGAALYLLAREISTSAGGLVALAYYLFLPFGAIASRAFQPDPLMVALIVWALWGMYGWVHRQSWPAALLAGGLAGAAILVKSVAGFFLLFPLGGLILAGLGIKKAFRNPQVYTVCALAVLPGAAYHVYGLFVAGFLEKQFTFRFFPILLTDPTFYLHWASQMIHQVGFGGLLAALLGLLLLRSPVQKGILFGIWLGYAIYGLTFAYHITSHDYYHLPLVPIVSLSLAPLAVLIQVRLASPENGRWVRLAAWCIVIFAITFQIWNVRSTLARTDYRSEVSVWEELGARLAGNSVIAITSDYGYRLAYYGWLHTGHWQTSGDLNMRALAGRSTTDMIERFEQQAEGKDFFLVTDLSEFDRQPELQNLLYTNYALVEQNVNYLIFDLRIPLHTKP